jgi:hypothetical protein
LAATYRLHDRFDPLDPLTLRTPILRAPGKGAKKKKEEVYSFGCGQGC